MSLSLRDEQGLRTLGARVAKTQDDLLSDDRTIAAVRSRLLAPRQRKGAVRWAFALAPTAALCGAVLFGWLMVRGNEGAAPSFRLRKALGSPQTQPGIVGAGLVAGQAGSALYFSDGSQMSLQGGAAGRVLHLEHHKARVALEHGRASVEIAKNQGIEWSFGAGPFTVRVLGTAFDLHWDPRAQFFEVYVRRGQTSLAGPEVGLRTISAGETVRVWLSEKRAEFLGTPGPTAAARKTQRHPQVASDPELESTPSSTGRAGALAAGEDRNAEAKSAQSASAGASATGTAAEPSASRPLRQARDSRSKRRRRAATWLALAKSGRYKAALAALDGGKDVDRVARSASAENLMLLADVGRYTMRLDLAERMLGQVRRRFAGTHAAAVAAFARGRIEADQRGRARPAARWFHRYLAEDPKGAFEQQARGRLIEALHRSGQTQAARAAARVYLDRFASGDYATLARRVLR